MDRRDFINTTAAASGLLFVKPSTAFGYQANSAVRLGLLGCGNRGTAVATSFAKNTTARLVALADIFPDKLAARQTALRRAERLAQQTRHRPAPHLPRLPRLRRARRLEGHRRHPDLHAALLPRPASRSRGRRRQARLLREAGRRRCPADAQSSRDRQTCAGQGQRRCRLPDPQRAALRRDRPPHPLRRTRQARQHRCLLQRARLRGPRKTGHVRR